MAERALLVGDCPVAPGAESSIALVSIASGQPVFWCPDCGSAWDVTPPADELNEVNDLQALAPAGVRLATDDDLRDVQLGARTVTNVDDRELSEDLDSVLSRLPG